MSGFSAGRADKERQGVWDPACVLSIDWRTLRWNSTPALCLSASETRPASETVLPLLRQLLETCPASTEAASLTVTLQRLPTNCSETTVPRLFVADAARLYKKSVENKSFTSISEGNLLFLFLVHGVAKEWG